MRTMTTSTLVTLVVGWIAAIALSLVGYLFSLEIKEFRRNRRMEAERERLGLRRA
jgi:hypothetical protein